MAETSPTEETKSARDDVASFAALGASVPFTSPRLLGARIRQNIDGRGFELILVNPAQTKGSYVMPWRAMPDIGAPTLFDLRLWEILSNLKEVYPTAIRREALKVAGEGMAGRLVASAARHALHKEQQNEAKLLALFAAQLGGGPNARLTDASSQPQDIPFSLAAQKTLEMRDPALMASLRALAETLSCLGPATMPDMAPLVRLKHEIAGMLSDFRDCLDQDDKDGETPAFRFLAAATETALHYAELAFAEIDARLGDMVDLLARPRINAAKLLERAQRTEWLLDGWGVLVAFWQRTPPELRHAIAWEMTLLLPPLPREVHEWFNPDQARPVPSRVTRVIAQGSDWRSGRNLEITARNEGLISFTLNYENRMSEARPQGSSGPGRVRIAKYKSAAMRKVMPTEAPEAAQAQSSGNVTKADGMATDLTSASDENLLRIVAMIDRLPDRTKLDGLLTDIRPRLARLRPPRPVTMTRLLFLPLSGALVNRAAWRQDPATIPRAALKPIFSLLRDLAGSQLAEAEEATRQALFSDLAIVERYGRPVWEAAARLCEKVTPGTRWAEAGFAPEDFRSMTRLAAGVWRHADALWAVLRRESMPVAPDMLRTALAGPAGEGPDVFRAAFRTLLLASGNVAGFSALASGMPPGISEIVIQTLEEWIETALPQLNELEWVEAVDQAEEIGRTLEALSLTPFFQIPRRRRQLSAFFWRLEEYCRDMFLEILEEEILPAIQADIEAYSDARFITLESHARNARRLEILGRQFGNDPAYDEIRQRLMKAFATAERAKTPLGITATDLARLCEILLGRGRVS
ncbi:MAG: hypothetical protein ING02_06095 [Roseomonas sp.]|nr:hypothetical protein [Roseomonas sp.]